MQAQCSTYLTGQRSTAHTLQGSAVQHIPYRAVQYNRRQCNVMQYNTIIDTPRGGGGRGGHFTDSSSCSLILIHVRVSLSIFIRINVTSDKCNVAIWCAVIRTSGVAVFMLVISGSCS